MGPDLWELYEYGEADDEVAAIIRLAHFGAVPVGVRVIWPNAPNVPPELVTSGPQAGYALHVFPFKTPAAASNCA